MADIKIVKQIVAKTPNRPGMLAEVTGAIADAGVNIRAICAYAMQNEAVFMLLTDDNQKALSSLKPKGYDMKEDEVVLVNLVNKVGSLFLMAKKLKDADIDLSYIYGSTGSASEALIVLKSDNNSKALNALTK